MNDRARILSRSDDALFVGNPSDAGCAVPLVMSTAIRSIIELWIVADLLLHLDARRLLRWREPWPA